MHLSNAVFIIFIVLFTVPFSTAQSCQCSIEEVYENRVEPCTLTIGQVINVSTTEELRNAFRQANQSAGNMTILIEDGIYPIASTSSYPYLTSDNLVIRSRTGNRDAVVLTGEGMRSVSPLTENGLSIQGNHVVIADLTIRDVGNHGIAMTGDEITIHNVKIQDTYEQMIKGNQAGGGAQNGMIQCSLFEYTAGVGPNWYIGGIDIHNGANWHVHDNIFRHIKSPVQSVAEHAIHFWNNSANNLVERNIILDCDRGIGFGLGTSPNVGGVIQNNMIFNDGNGQYDDVGIGLESSPNTLVFNNTIHIAYQNAIEYRFMNTQNVEIKNNLTNQNIRSRDGATGTLNNNYTQGQLSWYQDPNEGNLRLNQNYVQVIDQGESLNLDDDIDRNKRPSGLGMDIGAEERVLTTGSSDLYEQPILLKTFPNPSNQFVTIKLERGVEALPIQVVNVQGESFSKLNLSSQELHIIDVQLWPSGTYLVVQDSEHGKLLCKFVVSK